MLPSTYHPSAPDQFIGPARQAAEYVQKLARVVLDSQDPLRLIFSGPVGTGKTKLAALTLKALGASNWNLTKFNGTQVKMEEVEALAKDFHFTSLIDGYRVILIEEIHAVPPVARSRGLRTIRARARCIEQIHGAPLRTG
jgi:replication-associated recombination protein RarA